MRVSPAHNRGVAEASVTGTKHKAFNAHRTERSLYWLKDRYRSIKRNFRRQAASMPCSPPRPKCMNHIPPLLHSSSSSSFVKPPYFEPGAVVFESPQPTMVIGDLVEPLPEPTASMPLTVLYDSVSPSGTWPKTTCLPSSQEVTTVVTKNWDPLL